MPGTGVSVAGQRNLGNSFIVDGLSANDDAADLAGTYFSEEVIREFQVVTSGGGAEFGRASSGTISVVTQSGTNQLRGPRLRVLPRRRARRAQSARDAQGSAARSASIGFTSAVRSSRDRTFWFGNVERTQQDRTGIVTIAPADVARDQRARSTRSGIADRGSRPATSRPATTRPTCSAASITRSTPARGCRCATASTTWPARTPATSAA